MSLVSTIIGLVILYVLSLGPAIYLCNRMPAATPWIEKIYYPVKLLEKTPLDPPLRAYFRWWDQL